MRIVNFNRRIKTEGTWLNTYIDWNKTYCQDLHNKITSLYDYIMYNYPQYLIFNSPNKLHEKDSFVSFTSLIDNIKEPRLMVPYEKEIKLVIQDEDPLISQIKSFFFPCLLNYHQGFYNQSQYGDGCLVKDYSSLLYLDLQQQLTDTVSSMYHMWSYRGDDGTWGELTIETPSNQPDNYMFICFDPFSFDSTVEVYFNIENISYLSWNNNIVTFNDTQAQGERWQYFLFYRHTNLEFNCKETISYIFKDNVYYPYKSYIIPANTVFKLELNDILYFIDFDNTNILFDAEKDSPRKLLDYAILRSSKSIELIPIIPFFKYNRKLLVVTTDLKIQYNFPSGYLCLLNKQVTGENNSQNSIKHQWDSYFIAPIGNGGYFDIEWNHPNLEASYYANKLDGFTNQISVNLALNCRYINPDLEQFKLQTTSVNIPNWFLTTSKQEPYLTDEYNNIWTGQQSLVSRPHFNGEFVFLDIEYDTYSTAERNKKVHYFNATTKQSISLQPQLWLY